LGYLFEHISSQEKPKPKKYLVDFNVRDGRVEGTRPVDQSLAAVDQALLMHANE